MLLSDKSNFTCTDIKKGNLKETLEPSDGSFLTNESLVYHVQFR